MQENPPIVFIVDDDDAVRSSLRFVCKSVGLSATPFSSAAAFLEAYDPRQPGCLVLDVRMPGMSGLELQRVLHARGARWQVIFLSGRSDFLIRARHVAMAAGAVAVLAKPARAHDLFAAIERAIEHLRPAAPGPEQPAAD
jgi:two-component system, LuxR family, response regulator FixJ